MPPEVPVKKEGWYGKVRAFGTSLFPLLTLFLVVFFAVIAASVAVMYLPDEGSVSDSDSESGYATERSEPEDCNVYGINLHGEVVTYIPKGTDDTFSENKDLVSSENIISIFEKANADEKVKAIAFEIDSYGGSPVAGEEIANALKKSKKITVAYIRDAGASAAYWAATGAQKIYASKNSNVGSIGVTSSFAESIDPKSTFISLSSGKFKDTGNPDKPITAEEKALYMRDVRTIYENFIQAVSVNRNLPIASVRALADGSTVLGEEAKKDGLIDEIGNYYDVKSYIEEKLGEPATFCWY